jgi:hypothetical protein
MQTWPKFRPRMGWAGCVGPVASPRWRGRNSCIGSVGPVRTRKDQMRRPSGDALKTTRLAHGGVKWCFQPMRYPNACWKNLSHAQNNLSPRGKYVARGFTRGKKHHMSACKPTVVLKPPHRNAAAQFCPFKPCSSDTTMQKLRRRPCALPPLIPRVNRLAAPRHRGRSRCPSLTKKPFPRLSSTALRYLQQPTSSCMTCCSRRPPSHMEGDWRYPPPPPIVAMF